MVQSVGDRLADVDDHGQRREGGADVLQYFLAAAIGRRQIDVDLARMDALQIDPEGTQVTNQFKKSATIDPADYIAYRRACW